MRSKFVVKSTPFDDRADTRTACNVPAIMASHSPIANAIADSRLALHAEFSFLHKNAMRKSALPPRAFAG